MELTRLASFLNGSIKKYISEVAPTIKNSNLGYVIEFNDKVFVYNLEVAEAEEFPVWCCIGGDTPPTEGCGRIISDQMLENQHCFRGSGKKPHICPFCGGTEFYEYSSMEEWREHYG